MIQFSMANKISTLVFSFLFSVTLFAQQRKEVPNYIGHINDFANVLQANEISELEQKLLKYEDSTSTQIAVVIENSLEGRSEFDRAMDFARGWGVGQKDKRNGLVLYISMVDRKIYVVNADRTQGALTDGELGEIIRNDIRPYFKTNQYAQGISSGLDAIISALSGEFMANPKGKPSQFPMLVIFIVIIIVLLLISKRGGGLTGGMNRVGTYWFPITGGGLIGGGGGSIGGGSSWGGFGGGGGFNGGGAGGSW
ncbi:MAG: TPM domain-containing protein [Bacteroidetes bacterium]|nr:TPM domain-containing protein [Bacteroidota bacterium]